MAGEVVGTAYVEVRPKVDGFANEAQSKIAAPLQAAFAGIATGVVAAKVKTFFTDAFGEAEQAAKVTAQTGAVLKSTGEAAGVTAKHVEDYANQLSKLAAVDDEVIQQGENVLLTFTSIRNEAGKGNDVFDRATQAALDMSAAFGSDLQGAIVQVGKALQDPIQGLTALRRVGVSFTQQQKDQIAALQQSGDLLGAQKIILAELEKEFGGAAASQATATARLSVAFKNLEEAIGTALLPLINGLAKALTPLAQFLTQNKVAATALAVVLSGALLAGLTAWTVRAAQSTISTLSFGRVLSNTAQTVEQAGQKFAYSSQFNQRWADSLNVAGTSARGASASTGVLASSLAGLGIIAVVTTGFIELGNAVGLFDKISSGVNVSVDALSNHSARLQDQLHSLNDDLADLGRTARSKVDLSGAAAASEEYAGKLKDLEDKVRKLAQSSPTLAREFINAAYAAGLSSKEISRLTKIVNDTEQAHIHAARAAELDAKALDGQSDSTATLIDWVNVLNGKLNDQVDASLGSQGAAVSMDRAIQNLNETLAANAAGSLESRDATIQAEQSVVSFGKKIYDERLAVSDSTQATEDQIGALAGVRDSLAPGSALRTFLDDYINKLRNDIPGEVHTDFLLTLSNQTGLSVGDLNSLDVISRITTGAFGASGAIVNRPTVALIGEAGPEALIPLSQTPGNSPLGALGAGEVHIHYDGAGPTNPITAAHTTARVLRVHMALAGR